MNKNTAAASAANTDTRPIHPFHRNRVAVEEFASADGVCGGEGMVDTTADDGDDATGPVGHRFAEPLAGREESVSRFNRFRSPRSSAAVW